MQHPPQPGSGVGLPPQQEFEGGALNGTPSNFYLQNLYSSVFSAATMSMWRFFRATMRPTTRDTRKVRRMDTR